MMSKFIDLSVAIESGLPSDPPMMIPKITYVGHALGAENMKAFYPGLTAGDLPGGPFRVADGLVLVATTAVCVVSLVVLHL